MNRYEILVGVVREEQSAVCVAVYAEDLATALAKAQRLAQDRMNNEGVGWLPGKSDWAVAGGSEETDGDNEPVKEGLYDIDIEEERPADPVPDPVPNPGPFLPGLGGK